MSGHRLTETRQYHRRRRRRGVEAAITLLAALGALCLCASPAGAQGIGFQGGLALDPSQAYVGTFFESAPLADRIHFRPGIDGSFGSDTKMAIIDVVFEYKLPLGAPSPWTMYQGTGPVVTIERANDQVHPHGGLGGVFGFENRNGFFAEFKVAGGGAPSLRLGIGYAIRHHQP
jgi:hypothetical protein